MTGAFIFREAFAGLMKNITMTIAMIITTAISLALLGAGVMVTQITDRTKEIYLDRVEVMVQLDEETSAGDPQCTQSACQEVQKALDAQLGTGIESVTFRNRAESYDRFTELFRETDPVLVEQTSTEAFPAAFHVRLVDPLDTSPLDSVRSLPQVADVIDQFDDLRAATDNLDAIRNATFIIAAIQAIAAIFLIANMVQIAAFTRRDETAIMRLVGASRAYTQLPFVLEAVLAGLVGSIGAIGGLWAVKSWLLDRALTPLYTSQLLAPVTSADLWLLAPILLAVGVFFSAATSWITLRLYVRT